MGVCNKHFDLWRPLMYFIYCFYPDKSELLIFFSGAKGPCMGVLSSALLCYHLRSWISIIDWGASTQKHICRRAASPLSCNTQPKITAFLNLWSLIKKHGKRKLSQRVAREHSCTWTPKHTILEATLLNINVARESKLPVINALIAFLQW